MIKMICGTYGLPVDGRVVPKNEKSEPFSTTKEQEARLVSLGRAVYVDEVEDDAEGENLESGAPIGFDETPPEVPDELPELPEGVTAIPEYSEEMKATELREIGKMCGLSFSVGMTKKEMVAALDAHIEANMVEGEPDAEDADEEIFDAAEGVM